MVLPDTSLVVCPDGDGVSFFAGWGACDEVTERWWEIDNWDTWCSCWNIQKTSYMTMLSCLIYFLKSNFLYIHLLMLQPEIFQQLSLYGHGQQTYFICRWMQHHDIYHISGIKHDIISVII